MSVTEIFKVKYRDGEEKSQAFNWFDFDGLKKFVDEHEIISVEFEATGLPESGRPLMSKDVHKETIPKEGIASLSQAWIDERRKGY